MTATTSTTTTPTSPPPPSPAESSPGNAFAFHRDTPPMRRPGMNFLWRLECNIAKEEIEVGTPHGAGVRRSIANVVDGKVRGPRVEGEIVPLGAADWATVVEGTHSMKLDARYTVKTTDNHYIYVRAKGLYRPGPGTEYSKADPKLPPPDVVTQDDVEFFSHLRLEAAGPGPYNWLNGLVAVGCMTCVRTRIIIDAWYLTNFVGVEPENVLRR